MKLRVTGGTVFRALALIVAMGVLACAFAPPSVKRIPALAGDADPWPENSFRDWSFYANADDLPPGLSTRGSRVDGRADFQGTFVSGWFAPRLRVALFVAGFPCRPGNEVSIEVRRTGGAISRLVYSGLEPRDVWRPWKISLGEEVEAFRVVASDATTGEEGWLAVSAPVEARLSLLLLNQRDRALLSFFAQAIMLAVMALAVRRWITPLLPTELPDSLRPLVWFAGVALCGFVAFWAYFFHPLAGRVVTWTFYAVATATVLFSGRHDSPSSEVGYRPLLLALLVGTFYLAMLMAVEPGRLSYVAANRFDEGLPSDNEIPRAFAARLWKGESPRQLWGDWLSSDRPPLQSGWHLLTWPQMTALGVDADTFTTTSGLCFQLLWVLAAWAMLQYLGLNSTMALAAVAALAFTGVFLEYSIYAWPKLGGAALVVGASLLLARGLGEGGSAQDCALGGLCAALGFLSHGGVAFSLLGLVPVLWLWRRYLSLHRGLVAAVVFAATVAPWLAYQRCYEPPGNRLVKWHLAGSVALDDRGVIEAAVDAYREIGWGKAMENRWANIRVHFEGNWRELLTLDFRHGWLPLRNGESMFLVRSWALWNFGWVAYLLWGWRKRPPPVHARRPLGAVLLWFASGLTVWVALMFTPGSAIIHQGSLVTQIASFCVLASCVSFMGRRAFLGLSSAQLAWFLLGWSPRSLGWPGAVDPVAILLAAVSAAVLVLVFWYCSGEAAQKILHR